MTFDVEWRRGDTDDLIITLTADGEAMDLSTFSKITMCVTTLSEPPDGTTVLWKQEATILDQVSLKGKISVPMAGNEDEDVDTPFYFDIQGITTVQLPKRSAQVCSSSVLYLGAHGTEIAEPVRESPQLRVRLSFQPSSRCCRQGCK